MYGEGKTRGKVSELLIEAATNQACAALLFDGIASVTKPYIKIYFQKNYDDIRRLSSGGVQPNLNLGIIKATRIPLPPLEEQKQIVEELERIFSVNESLEKTINQSLKRAEKLRQSILKKAFEGKLVPQDPTDEPADKLLERIKAEKVKREAEAKAKKKQKQPGKSQQLELF
jgi:type I restriction enzyme S subunit